MNWADLKLEKQIFVLKIQVCSAWVWECDFCPFLIYICIHCKTNKMHVGNKNDFNGSFKLNQNVYNECKKLDALRWVNKEILLSWKMGYNSFEFNIEQ